MKRLIISLGLIAMVLLALGCAEDGAVTPAPVDSSEPTTTVTLGDSSSEDLSFVEEDEVDIGELI